MTCVVGLFVNNRVFVGADSGGFAGDTVYLLGSGKVFKLGSDYIIGVAGRRRVSDLLRYSFRAPEFPSSTADAEAFINSSFVPALQTFLRENRATAEEKESGGEIITGPSSLVLGVRGRGVFLVGADFAADRMRPDDEGGSVVAVGSGMDYALAAMLARPDLPPEDRIKFALGMAARLHVYVREPFVVEAFQ